MFVNDLIPLIDKTFRTYSDEEQKETILMKKVIFLVSIFMIVAAGFVIAQQPAPVKVEEGLLQGTSEDGLTIYRGIPFATPPVGDLRWRAPQPAA
jgi:para-nitrobenzyl esterase